MNIYKCNACPDNEECIVSMTYKMKNKSYCLMDNDRFIADFKELDEVE